MIYIKHLIIVDDKNIKKNRYLEILLPSAVHLEERLTVSHQSVRQASSQSDRNTQFGFFVSSRHRMKQSGAPWVSPGSGRMVKQSTAGISVGGSNPGTVNVCSGAAGACRPGFEPPT